MTSADSIRQHGALGAAHLEVRALREELAAARNYQDAIASFVAAAVVQTEVAAVRERDVALARLEAVRALHSTGAEVACRHCERGWPCATIRALDGQPETPPGSPPAVALGRPGAVPGTQVTPDPPHPLKSAPAEGAP